MRGMALIGVTAGLLACTPGSERNESSARRGGSKPGAAVREATAPTDEGANSGQSVCELARSEYAALRDAGNQCREDADCAEIYPGTCPQGPYYVNVAGDHAAISAAAAAMRVACGDVECEPPLSLGIARCAAGRCESGPRPAEPGCTDTRVTYMDGGRPTIGESHPTRGLGGGPLHAVGVPRSGTLRLTATVSGEDRQPWVAALQSTSVVPIDGTDFMPEADAMGTVRPVPSGAPGSRARRVHREFTVEPGVYLVGTRGAPGEVRYEAGLRDEHGKPMAVDRRGVVHLRSCEQ